MRRELLLKTPRFEVLAETHRVGGREKKFYFVRKADATVVVAHTASKVLLLAVDRPVVREKSVELPGGRVEKGESPLRAAKRELWEEVGIAGRRWRLLGTTYPLPSLTTERVSIYTTHIDEHERIDGARGRGEGIRNARLVPYAVARRMLQEGRLRCAVDSLALLQYFLTGQ